MKELWLTFELHSEACFSRGDGAPGVVDVEVSHDDYGFPYLGGRALKGLLQAEAAEILSVLELADAPSLARWVAAAEGLLGQPGSELAQEGKLSISDAQLPADLRAAVARAVEDEVRQGRPRPHPHDVLNTLTAIRRQTALDETGAPQAETLRAVRVILRGLPFAARLRFFGDPSPDDLALLAATVKSWRRAGSNKTRGYGRLRAELRDTAGGPSTTETYFAPFRQEVAHESPAA